MIDTACTTTRLQGDKSTYIGQRADLYRSDDEAIQVAMTTYIGQPADQYRFTPPPSARRIHPARSRLKPSAVGSTFSPLVAVIDFLLHL